MIINIERMHLLKTKSGLIKDYIYGRCRACENCRTADKTNHAQITPWPLSDSVAEAVKECALPEETVLTNADISLVINSFDLACPKCGSAWNVNTMVSVSPWLVPVDIEFLKDCNYNVEAERCRVLAAFGDIVGFSRWANRSLLSEKDFKTLMAEIFAEFMKFQQMTGYYVKLLGDGLMFVHELSKKSSRENEETKRFFYQSYKLLESVEKIIKNSPSPHPRSFRIRIASGQVWKMEFEDKTDKNLRKADYFGYTINLAARLLAVMSEVKIICNEHARDILVRADSETSGIITRPLNSRVQPLKGIDDKDLKSLWIAHLAERRASSRMASSRLCNIEN